MEKTLVIFATAMLVSAGLTPLASLLAIRLGVMDQPDPRKLHRTPIPRLGGLALYGGVALALLLFSLDYRRSDPGVWIQLLSVIGGGTVLIAVGVLDDGGHLRSLTKLRVGMPLAGLILALGGIRVTAWPGVDLIRAYPFPVTIVGLGLTVLWVVVITSSFSILDHMDGLCAGISAIAAAYYLAFAAMEGQILVGSLAAAVLGSSLGFLYWNRNPARIFMGDSGALFLGFVMATLGIKLRLFPLPPGQSWCIPVLIMGVPIFDTALVTMSRLRRGLNPLKAPGKDHTAHRLANLGFGQRGATFLLYGVALLSGLLSLWVLRLSVAETHALMVAVAAVSIIAMLMLERAPYDRQSA